MSSQIPKAPARPLYFLARLNDVPSAFSQDFLCLCIRDRYGGPRNPIGRSLVGRCCGMTTAYRAGFPFTVSSTLHDAALPARLKRSDRSRRRRPLRPRSYSQASQYSSANSSSSHVGSTCPDAAPIARSLAMYSSPSDLVEAAPHRANSDHFCQTFSSCRVRSIEARHPRSPPSRRPSLPQPCTARRTAPWRFVAGLALIHDVAAFAVAQVRRSGEDKQHDSNASDLLPPAPGKPQRRRNQDDDQANVEPPEGPQDICACAKLKHGGSPEVVNALGL